MTNAIEELEIHHEIESLTAQQRAAILLSTVDPRTAQRICSHLSREQIGALYLEAALLPRVSTGARRRILSAFRARVSAVVR
ncbi:MAG: hypothetical protein KAW17_10420 [Candidatus Eisenbacteria sp.]|nr:hypothetical protein [Candidatus Eisenbacteria bacterium]